jgi:cytochrome c5
MLRATWMAIAGLMAAGLGVAQSAESKLPEGEGKQVTERVCSACHAIDSVVSERHS